ncbi:MAG: hypothetical protein GY856_25805 [bacterium]|nr:hypothetical protein [bacterium]
MILYYAVGGGLGHLTRARAVIHTLGLSGPVAVVTASPWALDRRVLGDWRAVSVPCELARDRPGYRRWLQRTFREPEPSTIFIDAFPAGIQGELCEFPWPRGARRCHVARLLRWPRYAAELRGELPEFHRAFVVEPLTPAHREIVERYSESIEPLRLSDPPAAGPLSPAELGAGPERPFWLIVHAGSEGETLELLRYARAIRDREAPRRRLVLVAPNRPRELAAGVEYLDHFPARDLFPAAERIFTACGFNAMRQTEPFREKHRFLPFERRFDDQFRRAARRRRGA